MNSELKKSAQKVQAALNEYGLELTVIEFTESTRTAQDAANAIGCELGQIAKSLIFKCKNSNKPVCVIASGANRVDEKKVKAHLGEKIERADADYVLEHTGYAIGGIPPIGHNEAIMTLIDEDILSYDEIWAAAGTPHAVFKLTPKDLVAMTKGTVTQVRV